ncbi:lantibiotic dehydratase [Amycolatopsis sp. NPDC004169]|uniref:lantibiotic dehydratase n=1 Tax=Amycolatopsis sp. NPDC004169 TaxID=3154453 RepID=UPI0033B89264
MDYQVEPVAMVRAPLLPAGAYPAEPGGLRRAMADSRFREALWIASPSLAADADTLFRTGGTLPPKRRRTVVRALTRYLIRATSRPTPFGAFAGVGLTGWGDELDIRLGEPRRTARLDHGAVLRLAEAFERDDRVLAEVPVVADVTIRHRGDRIVLTRADAEVSLRCTAPVARVLVSAATPVTFRTLCDELARAHPDVDRAKLRGLLTSLVAQGVLQTTLRPPTTALDPLAHLCSVLPTAHRPSALVGALDRYRVSRLGDGVEPLRELYDRFGVRTRQHHVQVDLGWEVSGTLPTDLGDELSVALDAAFRLCPAYPDPLADYAKAVERRYGDQAVPLLDLLDGAGGLGPPAGYTRPAPPGDRKTGPVVPESVPFLRAKVHRALRDREVEVVLTEAEVAALADPDGLAPPSADLFVAVAARAEGWLAVLTPVNGVAPGGRSFGRFTHVDAGFAEPVRALAAHERAASPGVLFADLGYAHPDGHLTNVALGSGGHPYRVTAGGAPGDLSLADLLVEVRDGRLRLRSARDGRRVLLRAANLLTPATAPNAVRFASEVSEHGYWRFGEIWGDLAHLPFLPRVRIGRVVLQPARWQLPDTDFAAWRRAWPVPRHVHAGVADHRLLLDLDQPDHLAELAAQRSRGSWYVEEAIPGPEEAACQDGAGRPHHLEVVVSLRAVAPARVPAADPPVPLAPLHHPGEDDRWYFELRAPVSQHDEVIRAVDAVLGGPWWFERTADPTPGLGILVHGPDPAPLLRELAVLARRGLVGGYALTAYRATGTEDLKIADSRSMLAVPSGGLPRVERCAFTADVTLRALGFTTAELVDVYASVCPADVTKRRRLHREAHRRRSRLSALLGGSDPGLRAWAATAEARFAELPKPDGTAFLIDHARRSGLSAPEIEALGHGLRDVTARGLDEQ